MTSRSTQGLTASEVIALLDQCSDEEKELESVHLDGESDDDEKSAGDFVTSEGDQSLVPDDLLSSRSAGFFQSLAQENADPSHRDSLLQSDLSLTGEGKKIFARQFSSVLFT